LNLKNLTLKDFDFKKKVKRKRKAGKKMKKRK